MFPNGTTLDACSSATVAVRSPAVAEIDTASATLRGTFLAAPMPEQQADQPGGEVVTAQKGPSNSRRHGSGGGKTERLVIDDARRWVSHPPLTMQFDVN